MFCLLWNSRSISYIPLTVLPFFSLLSCRFWRIPQGSVGWWWPHSLQSATLPPTLQPSPPHTTCPPIWLTLTLSQTLTLSTPLSAPGICPITSTTSTTFPPCTAIQVLTCWLDTIINPIVKKCFSQIWIVIYSLFSSPEIIPVYGMSNYIGREETYSKPQPKKIKEQRLERQNRLNSPPSTLYKGSLGQAHNGYRWPYCFCDIPPGWLLSFWLINWCFFLRLAIWSQQLICIWYLCKTL